MSPKFRRPLLSSATERRLAESLARIDLSILQAASRSASAASPSARARARKQAGAIARKQRAQASRRSPDGKIKVAELQGRLAAVRERLAARFASGELRPPNQVIASVLARLEGEKRGADRTRDTALLVTADQPGQATFDEALAKAFGLDSPTRLQALGIRTRLVSSARQSRAVYSVRLPIRRASMRTEVHNLAWALRKSGQFVSVRAGGGHRWIFAEPGHAERAERVFAWPHVLTRANLAHDLAPEPGGKALGEGIVIAHPDTGWSEHPSLNSERIDPVNSFNAGTGETGSAAAQTSSDPADSNLPTINHGTGTASIIIGAKEPLNGSTLLPDDDLRLTDPLFGLRNYLAEKVIDREGTLTGVAPRATLRPIKFIDDVPADIDRSGLNGIGVVRFVDEDLVAAIDHARTSGSHVISLSVGGLVHSAVKDAIDAAVEADIIVVAAAGQTYTGAAQDLIAGLASGLGIGSDDTVITPAAYANVIAAAGCIPDGRPWDESFRDPNVDITAPADAMWAADFEVDGDDRSPMLRIGSGTSYSAAFMAGAAALWLAHWGRDHLLQKYPDKPLAWVFRHQLQATARKPQDDWDTGRYGPGIVDVLALLRAKLPDPGEVGPPPATVDNLFTILSGFENTPAGALASTIWALLWDLVTTIPPLAEGLLNASWAAAGAAADAAAAAAEQALAEVIAFVERGGQAAADAAQETIDGLTGLIAAAGEAGEEVVEAAAEETEEAAEDVEEFVEEVADAAGEVAEDVVEVFTGWL